MRNGSGSSRVLGLVSDGDGGGKGERQTILAAVELDEFVLLLLLFDCALLSASIGVVLWFLSVGKIARVLELVLVFFGLDVSFAFVSLLR